MNRPCKFCGLPLKDGEVRSGFAKHRGCYALARAARPAMPPPELYPVGYGAWMFWMPLGSRQVTRRLGARL